MNKIQISFPQTKAIPCIHSQNAKPNGTDGAPNFMARTKKHLRSNVIAQRNLDMKNGCVNNESTASENNFSLI